MNVMTGKDYERIFRSCMKESLTNGLQAFVGLFIKLSFLQYYLNLKVWFMFSSSSVTMLYHADCITCIES
jgi:hypothetical protein